MIPTEYTWGISGPVFLLVYVVLAGMLAVVGLRARRALVNPSAPRPVGHLDRRPYDVAYLNGGAELAVTAALSAMHRAGTIRTSGRGTVVATGRPEPGTDELERAVHHAARTAVRWPDLPAADAVRSALQRIDARLVGAGLLLDAERRRRLRGVAMWTFAVAALGVTRFLAGVAAGRPVGFLVVLVLMVVVAGVVQFVRVPRHSRAGDAALADLVRRHHALAPAMRPDWAVYGPSGAALAVAVYGAGAVWASDPAFAAEVAVQRASSWSGGSSAGDSSGGSWWISSSGGASGSDGGGSGGGGGGGGCGGGGCGG